MRPTAFYTNSGRATFQSTLFLLIILASSIFGTTASYAQRGWPQVVGEALRSDDPAPLRRLVGAGFDLDEPDQGSGKTLVMIAVDWNKPEVVKFLVNEGAKLTSTDRFGNTVLHVAAQKSPVLVKLVLAGKPDVKITNNRGMSAAETAAFYGSKESLDLLVAAGAPYTPDLVFSSALGQEAELEKQLASKPEINATNKTGMNALAAASRTGKINVVRKLLSKGANPNEGGYTTPLIVAAGWERADVVAALLEAKADPNLSSEDGTTPLVNAISMANPSIVEMLLKKGAKVETGKRSFMHEAARADSPRILKMLLDRGGELNAPFGEEGFTPLMIAASEGKAKATAFLLKAGARVGVKDKKYGMTALQLAENNRQQTIIEIFQDPDKFDLSQLDRDFTKSKEIAVADWKKKFSEFDPLRGNVATFADFKRTFGEPTRITDIDTTTFWYYQCADGLVEIKLVNPKVSGGTMMIQEMSTVAEPKSAKEKNI